MGSTQNSPLNEAKTGYKFKAEMKSRYASDMIVFVKFLANGIFVVDRKSRAAILSLDGKHRLDIHLPAYGPENIHPTAVHEHGDVLWIYQKYQHVYCTADLKKVEHGTVYAEESDVPLEWTVPEDESTCYYDHHSSRHYDILESLDITSVPEKHAGYFGYVLGDVDTYHRDITGKEIRTSSKKVRSAYCYHAKGDQLLIGHDGNMTLWTKS